MGIHVLFWWCKFSHWSLKTQTICTLKMLCFSFVTCYIVPSTYMLFCPQIRMELAYTDSYHPEKKGQCKRGEMLCVAFLGEHFWLCQVGKSKHERNFFTSILQCLRDIKLICPYRCISRLKLWVQVQVAQPVCVSLLLVFTVLKVKANMRLPWVPESQSSWGRQGLLGPSGPPPAQAEIPRPGCSGLCTSDFWSPRRLCSLLGSLCGCSASHTAQKSFLVFRGNLWSLVLMFIAFCSGKRHHWQQFGSIFFFFTPSFQVFIDEIPWSLLPSRLNSPSSLSLPTS